MNRRTVIVETAMVMLVTLKQDGSLLAGEFDRRIVRAGGDPLYKQPAARWLRDHGVTCISRKAGPLSTWSLVGADAIDLGEFLARMNGEAYSEHRAAARAVAKLTGPGSKRIRDMFVRAAIGYGGEIGMGPDEVVADCKPLEMPAGWNGGM